MSELRASVVKAYETGGKWRWFAAIRYPNGSLFWKCEHAHYLREGVGHQFTHTYRDKPLPRGSWSAAACAAREIEVQREGVPS